MDFHPLRIAALHTEADDAVVVQFDVPESLQGNFRFLPGQHLTLRAHIGGEELRRSYSLCASPDEDALRIGVRRVPGGKFSNWLAETARAGDVIDIMAPQGRFGAPALVPVAASKVPTGEGDPHYLGIAGGSGITPILSLMKHLLARDPRARFTLLYGNRQLRSAMFLEELEDLKNRYLTRLAIHHVFSREHADSPLNAGRLTQEKIAQFLDFLPAPASISHAFVCGPHALNDEAEAALLQAGMPAERIHVERFGVPADAVLAAPQVRIGDASQADVLVIRDGVKRQIAFRESDASILDAAAAAGLEVPFSCKSGVCCTCRAKVLEGAVRMDRNFALEKSEVDAGFVLTCQSRPLTPRVVLSFDER